MRLPSIGVLAFFLLVGAEIVAYGLVIQKMGLLFAVLFGLVSLALGFAILKRLGLRLQSIAAENLSHGRQAWQQLKQMGWSVLAALLLILPGFLSNMAGLVLAILNLGIWFSKPSNSRHSDDSVVDLDPDDWRSHDPGNHDHRHTGSQRSLPGNTIER